MISFGFERAQERSREANWLFRDDLKKSNEPSEDGSDGSEEMNREQEELNDALLHANKVLNESIDDDLLLGATSDTTEDDENDFFSTHANSGLSNSMPASVFRRKLAESDEHEVTLLAEGANATQSRKLAMSWGAGDGDALGDGLAGMMRSMLQFGKAGLKI